MVGSGSHGWSDEVGGEGEVMLREVGGLVGGWLWHFWF
jgi:hypothetical protein